MKDIIRIYNPTIRFSKFTSNKWICEEFGGFISKLFWRETFSLFIFYSIKEKNLGVITFYHHKLYPKLHFIL